MCAAIACAAIALGCGGGVPLGHPAHVLTEGKTTLGAGVSGQILGGITRTTAETPGRWVGLTMAPGVAPWVGGRVGLGNGFEAGLTGTSRALRLDARRAFESGAYALSIGLGASALMPARPGAEGAADAVYGGGIDVPILVGWRSQSDLFALWIGPSAGLDLVTGQLAPGDLDPVSVQGRHLRVGGQAGLRVGLRHVYGFIEVGGAYHWADGTIDAAPVVVEGVTVTPAGGIVLAF